MLGTWIVFGIAIVLGIHGIMRLVRQSAYFAIASNIEVFINMISDLQTETHNKELSHEERKDLLSRAIETANRLFDGIFRKQRWLLWERSGAVGAGVTIGLFIEALEDIDGSAFERFIVECRDVVEGIGFSRDRFRDCATREVIWAAATFSLAGLVIGLFALVT